MPPLPSLRDRDRIAYVLKGYPRLSEVFIASEIHRLEQLELPLRLFVVKAADEDVQHAVISRVKAQPSYLPETTSLSATRLVPWLAANIGAFRPALTRVVARRPLATAKAAGMAFAQAVRARRTFLAPPRKLYLKEFLQAVALADELISAGDVRHLHAHFAHGTTTITWLAATITGLPFSFTGHAKDIYTEDLNPAGLLRRKMDAAGFVVTCTETNRRHLQSLGSRTPVHLVYHGLNADFERLVSAGADRAPTPRIRLLAVGRLVRKKGLDTFVDACELLRDGGLDFEAVIAGESGDHELEVRRRVLQAGLADQLTFLGPLTQDALYEQYQRATVFALPCRVLDDGDRDGIPNVLMEAMACGVPVVTTYVSGIGELVHHEDNGLVVPPDDPSQLAAAIRRLADHPVLASRLGEAGRSTVSTEFDAGVMAARMAALVDVAGASR